MNQKIDKENDDVQVEDIFRRNIIVLGLIGLALIALFVLGNIIRSSQRDYDPGDISQYISMDANISHIIIESEEETALQKIDGLWTVSTGAASSYRARPERVEDFLEAALSVQFIRRVSKSLNELETFGLEEGVQALSLLDDQERLISRLYFGSVASQRSEQYFRLDDVPEIYAIDTGLSFYLDQTTLYWTDLRFWENVDEEVTSFFRMYDDGRRDEWTKDAAGLWLSANNEEEAPPELEATVLSFFTLEGEGIVDALPEDAEYLLDIGVETGTGTQFIVSIFRQQPQVEGESSVTYYATQSENAALRSPAGDLRTYVLPEWRYNGFTDF